MRVQHFLVRNTYIGMCEVPNDRVRRKIHHINAVYKNTGIEHSSLPQEFYAKLYYGIVPNHNFAFFADCPKSTKIWRYEIDSKQLFTLYTFKQHSNDTVPGLLSTKLYLLPPLLQQTTRQDAWSITC